MESPTWLIDLSSWLLTILPVALWVGFWVFAVDWSKMWAWLAAGAWVPVLLLSLIAALVWSSISPSECDCLRFVQVPNFCWQLGAIGGLVACALLGGWIQGLIHFHPIEVNLDPPAHADHGHHGHGHH